MNCCRHCNQNRRRHLIIIIIFIRPWYYIGTCIKVQVYGKKNELSNCWDGRPQPKSKRELETVNNYPPAESSRSVVGATLSEGCLVCLLQCCGELEYIVRVRAGILVHVQATNCRLWWLIRASSQCKETVSDLSASIKPHRFMSTHHALRSKTSASPLSVWRSIRYILACFCVHLLVLFCGLQPSAISRLLKSVGFKITVPILTLWYVLGDITVIITLSQWTKNFA